MYEYNGSLDLNHGELEYGTIMQNDVCSMIQINTLQIISDYGLQHSQSPNHHHSLNQTCRGEGEASMSDSPKQLQISDKVVETLVQSIFRKNGVNPEEAKRNISDEQKRMIKEMVEDLKKQVEEFNQNQKKEKKG